MRKMILVALLLLVFAPLQSHAQNNTLLDARVGEWALYSTNNASMQERHSVIARRQRVVVVKIESIINGKVISSQVENMDISDPEFLRGAQGSENVTVAGGSYNCMVVKRGNRNLYYSNAIPVTGLVAVQRGGQRIKELIDFGK